MSTAVKVAAARAAWMSHELGHLIDSCESPIEELLLWAFLMHTDFPGVPTPLPGPVDELCARGILPPAHPNSGLGVRGTFVGLAIDGCFAYVLQQIDIACRAKRYRADFAVLCLDAYAHSPDSRILFRAAIEADGHDFHERTKEQARRDKARDRDLVGAGWEVIRFTGSDIYRDAEACVAEVFSIVRSRVDARRAG